MSTHPAHGSVTHFLFSHSSSPGPGYNQQVVASAVPSQSLPETPRSSGLAQRWSLRVLPDVDEMCSLRRLPFPPLWISEILSLSDMAPEPGVYPGPPGVAPEHHQVCAPSQIGGAVITRMMGPQVGLHPWHGNALSLLPGTCVWSPRYWESFEPICPSKDSPGGQGCHLH